MSTQFEFLFISYPVPRELDDAHEGASKAGVDLAWRTWVLDADLVALLQVEKAACVAGDLHGSPSPLAARHLGPVVHLDGEADLLRLLQVAHLDEMFKVAQQEKAPGQKPGRDRDWEPQPLLQGREGS